ncbi:MAG: UDP-N-acetylmuramoyl-tripeptide--D-alanyl-D-alanine ligase [Legionella sp.]
MNLFEIADLLNCSVKTDALVTGFATDSRKVMPGDLFVAIKGESVDGHAYIADAMTRGAVAILCTKLTPQMPIDQLVVPDVVEALAVIATHHRQKLACRVIALTGSNGKTTVKEMIASILPQPSYATPGNLNNHLGVPLSVGQLKSHHRYAVFELGANHKHEIAHTVAIVKPHVALINNIAPAHIGEFGSIDGVAHAKGEIYQGLRQDGIAIINADDAYADFWLPLLTEKKILRFSTHQNTDIHAEHISMDAQGRATFTLVLPQGQAIVRLLVPGVHNVSNALAAAACTYAIGLDLADIVRGLEEFSGVPGRMSVRKGKNQAIIIDDTYNANLRSVLSALSVLATYKGQRVFIFGDMSELGSWSQEHHQEVGRFARQQGIDLLMTCGSDSRYASAEFGEDGKHYETKDELLSDILPRLKPETTLLVKGSRSAAMETIVAQLLE